MGSKWVGSEISCSKSCIVVRDSICMPLWDVTSSGYDGLDLTLKSPSIIIKEGLGNQCDNNITFWFWSVISQTMHWVIKELSITLKLIFL